MTVIENNNPRVQYQGPIELDDELAITFPYSEKDTVKCLLNEMELEYNIDYTIIGSTATMHKAAGANDTITFYRTTPLDQQAEFPQNNRFDSAKLNEALDKICMQQQEQLEAINRCMKASIATMMFDGSIPVPKPNRALKINEEGTGFALSEYNPDEAILLTEDFKNEAIAAGNLASEKADAASASADAASASADAASASADAASASADAAAEMNVLQTANYEQYSQQLSTDFNSYKQNLTSSYEGYESDLTDKYDAYEEQMTSKAQEVFDKIGAGSYHPPLLQPLWTDHLLNDIAWLRADTFSWQDGRVYSRTYNTLANAYDNGVDTQAIDVENFTRKGNPILENGIASGFSASDYLSIDTPFAPIAGQTWEFNQRIKWDVLGETQNILSPNIERTGITLATSVNKTLVFYAGNDGTSWNIASAVASTLTIDTNIWYTVRISFNGTNYKVDVSTDEGETWTNYINVASTARIASVTYRIGNYPTGAYLRGQVDLTKTYIKIDNEYWWQPFPITYKLAPNKMRIVGPEMEETILNLYNTTGVAWYHIVDKENQRFKLARSKYSFTGYRDSVGAYVTESLPSITVVTTASGSNNSLWHIIDSKSFAKGDGSSNVSNFDIGSGTYQSGAPVQQRATQMYLYFYVGEYDQSAIQQTAGLNAELFNSKLDKDINNITDEAKQAITNYVAPSDNYVLLTIGASATRYIAPCNGYFSVKGGSTNWVFLIRLLDREGDTNEFNGVCALPLTSGYNFTLMLPVKKNDIVKLSYGSTITSGVFKFIPAVGENINE